MRAYIVRRVLYTIPLVLGVCFFTFVLFDVVFSPRDRAIRELGKHADVQQIANLMRSRGWDKGLFYNAEAEGLKSLTDTRFVNHMSKLLLFRFGRSEKTHEPIGRKIRQGMVPSLTLTVPIFVLGLIMGICLSLMVAYFQATYLDLGAVVVCVAFMSISILVYILAGQWLLAQHLRLFPIYGYAGGIHAWRFLILPIFIAVIKGLGGDVRFYRTVLL